MNQKVNYSGFVDLLIDSSLYQDNIRSDNRRLELARKRGRAPDADTLGRQGGGGVTQRRLYACRTE